MKKEVVLAIVAGLGLASAGMANTSWDPSLDQVISINDGNQFTLYAWPPQPPTVFTAQVTASNPIVGFSFSGIAVGSDEMVEWASDTILRITTPDGQTISRGGHLSGVPADEFWDFQGVQSAIGETKGGVEWFHGVGADQHGYIPTPDGLPDFAFSPVTTSGLWTFEFEQDIAPEADTGVWENVTITLHSVPSPGMLALFGLAGLTARRRR